MSNTAAVSPSVVLLLNDDDADADTDDDEGGEEKLKDEPLNRWGVGVGGSACSLPNMKIVLSPVLGVGGAPLLLDPGGVRGRSGWSFRATRASASSDSHRKKSHCSLRSRRRHFRTGCTLSKSRSESSLLIGQR